MGLGLGIGNQAAGGCCGGDPGNGLSSKTASGERMNAAHLTAAHRKLKSHEGPGDHKANGKSVVVRINDAVRSFAAG